IRNKRSYVMNNAETHLLTEIRETLLKFPEYWEDGNLLSNRLIEDLRNYEEPIIEALLSNPLIKDTYSIEVKSMKIFKVEDFISVLSFKKHFNNSYTRYANDI